MQTHRHTTRRAVALATAAVTAALGLGLLTAPAHATVYDIGAGGNWTDAATWNPAVAGGPTAADTVSVASIPATRTVSLNGDEVTKTFTIAGIAYNEADAVIIRSLAVGTGGITTRRTLQIAGDLVKDGAGTLTLRSPISGGSNYGMLLVVNGNVSVNAGTLNIGGGSAEIGYGLQGATLAGTITVANGATLGLNTPNSATFGAMTNHGTLWLANANGVPIPGLSGSGEVVTTATAAGTKTITLTPTAATATFTGNITENANLKFAITKAGGNRQVLSGANTFSGTVKVSAGVLQFGSSVPSGNINVNGGVLGLGSDLSRDLGTAVGQVQLTAVNAGFAAYGADRSITLSGGADLTWNSGAGTPSFFAGNGMGTMALSDTTATHKVTLSNGIVFGGVARYFDVSDGAASVDAELSGALSQTAAPAGSLGKQGAGTLALTANSPGLTTKALVLEGVLLLTGSGALENANYDLKGGVLGLGNGDMTRAMGTSGGTVQLQADGSGFAAFGANRTVSIGSGASLTWASTLQANTFFKTAGSTMALSAANATHTLTFANNVNLNEAERTILVPNGAAAVDARMTGLLSGTGASALRKTGTGTLCLDNDNNAYASATTVADGHLGGDGKVPGNLVMAGGGFAAEAGKVLHVAGNLDLSAGTDSVSLIGAAPTARTVVLTYAGSRNGTFDDTSALPARFSVDYSVAGEIALVPPARATVVLIR